MANLYIKLHPTTGFTAVATGTPVEVSSYDIPQGILVSGTFVATLKIEVSYDGTNWAQFGADVTAPGTVKIDIPVKQVRARVSAYTSGTVVVGLGATNIQRGDELA